MKWTIDSDWKGMTIRDYLKEVQQFSRRILVAVKQEGSILVNGVPQTVRYVLQENDQLEVKFPEEEIGPSMIREDMDLSLLYEDDAVLVVDKPAGMATIPSLHQPTGTLANGILGYYERKQIPYTFHVVTRLDKDTSGLVLIAKHRYSHSLLSTQQKQGTIERTYQAIVEGHLEQKEGTIDAPIDRKEGSIIERAVVATGKKAVTHFQVNEYLVDHTLVEIELETGRTHQIRVHFSHINHPLAGDDLYGGKNLHMKRQALHCSNLKFEQPFTKEIIQIESALPNDLETFLNRRR